MSSLAVRSSPRLVPVLSVLVVLAVFGVGSWYANHPRALPTSSEAVQASTPTGEPVYLGVFASSDRFTRTIHLSGVKVHTTSNTEVSVVPLLCREGTVGVTSEPSAFCAEVINPEGATFGPGDALLLQVTSDEPAVAVIDRIRIGFREGLQWGTEPAGSPSVVRVLPSSQSGDT